MESNEDPVPDGGPHLPAGRLDPSRLLAVLPSVEADWREGPRLAAPKARWRPRLIMAASVALVAAAASAATLMVVNAPRAERVAQSAETAQTLAKSVAALNARLDSIEKLKPRDDTGDLRRAVGELKSASSKDLDAALSRLSQRIDSLDRQQTAKADKLDQAADARGADLAQRLDRLEKRIAAAPTPPPPAPPAPPKLGPNVSMETTGSIKAPTPARDPAGPVARDRPVLSGYVVLGASPNAAVIADRFGERAFRIGDVVPGAGRVERIERRGPAWVVRTEAGLIPAAQFGPSEVE